MIKILAKSNNSRGDLFTRLLRDYFYALGYEDCRFNIAKSGREIDVQARHRTESRILVAEARARAKPVGGADINKFVGATDAEGRRSSVPVAAYFVSLSAFTGSAYEQEGEFDPPRVILVDSGDIRDELAQSHVIVPAVQAAERAGRCASQTESTLRMAEPPTLLAHDIGWVWAITFSRFGQLTHVCLVHADGEPLGRDIANKVLLIDAALGGSLASLQYLDPQPAWSYARSREDLERDYRAFVTESYGEITLEGLPADEEVGSKRLRLEAIYVPTDLEAITARDTPSDDEVDSPHKDKAKLTVGYVLERHNHIAILGPPGAGKSTLVKRLATAYASKNLQTDLGDELPDRNWLPLVIRCRQVLGSDAPIVLDVLSELGRRAELTGSEAFGDLVGYLLRTGRALVLVDGLDELTSDSLRMAFVQQLRVFMATYPTVPVVITSREAGFRSVAPALASSCHSFRVADLDQAKITHLTLAWHREVVGRSKEIEQDAAELAAAIWSADRVRLLAVNPLLLTTLLLVRRWIGELPRRRSVLYAKAIEVLLMTWNVEGHDPIEQDEAIPQLAYLALRMMEGDEKQASLVKLSNILAEARLDMPELLGFAKTSVGLLVKRIEDRSSLLIQSGHLIENGVLRPVYEFKHLTFQEYLAAVAIVNGYFKEGNVAGDIASLLEHHVGSTAWKEVVPLAAVLAGRRAGPVLDMLTRRAIADDPKGNRESYAENDVSAHALLRQCLADEVQVAPDLAQRGLEALVRRWPPGYEGPEIGHILVGRYSSLLEAVLRDLTPNTQNDITSILSATSRFSDHVYLRNEQPSARSFEKCLPLLEGEDPFDKLCGALCVMHLAWGGPGQRGQSPGKGLHRIAKLLKERCEDLLLLSRELQYAACWALAWLGSRDYLEASDVSPALLKRIFDLWRRSNDPPLERMAAWAFWALPLIEPQLKPLGQLRGHTEFLRREQRSAVWNPQDRKQAVLVAALYFGAPWSRDQLIQMVPEIFASAHNQHIERRLLNTLGASPEDP